MRWDVFCQVVDNYGDAGVCWRLARELCARGERVRLWIDDARPLQWMAGLPIAGCGRTAHQGIEVLPWRMALQAPELEHLAAPDVLIEAFGCEVPQAYLQALADGRMGGAQAAAPPSPAPAPAPAPVWPQWLNLEYLSAEAYVERMHLLPSPVMSGPATGQRKTFFYPGFTPRTGGLLREPDVIEKRASFGVSDWRSRFLAAHAPEAIGCAEGAAWISLFAYEPACLRQWLPQWANGPQPVQLLAAAGRSQEFLRQCWARCFGTQGSLSETCWKQGTLAVHWLPFLPQPDFDQLLWACDCNIVRGEDSLVRALWAGRPFLWHLYPQDDDAHHAKLDAFLDWLEAPRAWRQTMHHLNAIPVPQDAPTVPTPSQWQAWQPPLQAAQARLLAQDDLVTQLQEIVAG